MDFKMDFKESSYTSPHKDGEHRIYYSDWGPEDGAPIICIHGLTGNGHDFDYLAPELVKQEYRVIAPDLPGRGRSDFLDDPLGYNYQQYISDLETLLTHLNLNKPASVDWLGVSLGGLLGIRMAANKNTPIRRLIMNDVGPSVPKAALDFIAQVIAPEYTFDTIADLEKRMRETRGLTWGPVTDEQWTHMARHNARGLNDGRITYAYDPKIAINFKETPIGEIDLWPCWEKISSPTLLLQGKDSMLLTSDIIDEMRKKGSEFDLTVFEGCGHVPSLMAPNQIETIKNWLQNNHE